MKVITTIAEARKTRSKIDQLALVPTMGALHAGHTSLMSIARRHGDTVAVSIFVNPTQFGPKEDFSNYPRPIDEDLKKCERAGVDVVFNPSSEEMYREGVPDVFIDIPTLTGVLEGQKRPGHFKGVCQVVAKLFNILTPDVAVFGQKDYQQLRVLTALVEALDWPIKIVPAPTVRDPDGIALSSRNQYLSADDRKRALSISRALRAAEEEIKTGYKQANRLITTMQKVMLEQHLLIDYIAAVDPVTFKNVQDVTGPTLLAIAARAGNTRLIDNTVVQP